MKRKQRRNWNNINIVMLGAIIGAASLCGMAAGADEEWPQWRGPHRDGKSASTGLMQSWKDQTPKLIWQSEGAGAGYASVSIADGRIYSTGNREGGQAVVAWDQNHGQRLWSTQVTDEVPKHGYDGSRSTPTFDEGRLYVVTSNGGIVCLNAEDGEILWRRPFSDWDGQMMSGWGFSESPLVDGPWVLCTPGGKDAAIVALDKQTGDEVWRAAVPKFGDGKNHGGVDLKSGAAYSSIMVSHGAGVKQYVQILGQGVVSVRASDGQFLWGYEDVVNNVANIPTPIVHEDLIFCSTGYQTGSVLLKLSRDGDGVRADEQYFLDERQLQNHHGGLVLVDGYLYGGQGHNKGFPICVELATGKVMWGGDFRGPGDGSAAVTYADGQMIFRYQDGTLALIEASPEAYRLNGSFNPDYQEGQSWAHPVVVDGRLYLREQDKLLCYDLKAE